MAKQYNFQTFRGDTFEFELRVNGLDDAFDSVDFTVKGKYVDNFTIIHKDLSDGITYNSETGNYLVVCNPEDTNDVTPGAYVYDVQVSTDGMVYTVLYGKLNIKEDVTRG